jgi:hypothetical protein
VLELNGRVAYTYLRGMRQLFSKADLRSLSSVLAVVILLGSSPLTVGVAVRPARSHPEITADICRPIQSFDLVSTTLLARPADVKPEPLLRDLGPVATNVAMQLIEFRVAPDTPPPKSHLQ